MSEYELLKNLTEVGIKLGYAGEELRTFVAKAQEEDREERQRVRQEKQQEAEHLERETEAARKHELSMERLRRTGPAQTVVQSNHPKPKLPKYDEDVDDLDAYLEGFE